MSFEAELVGQFINIMHYGECRATFLTPHFLRQPFSSSGKLDEPQSSWSNL